MLTVASFVGALLSVVTLLLLHACIVLLLSRLAGVTPSRVTLGIGPELVQLRVRGTPWSVGPIPIAAGVEIHEAERHPGFMAAGGILAPLGTAGLIVGLDALAIWHSIEGVSLGQILSHLGRWMWHDLRSLTTIVTPGAILPEPEGDAAFWGVAVARIAVGYAFANLLMSGPLAAVLLFETVTGRPTFSRARQNAHFAPILLIVILLFLVVAGDMARCVESS